MSSRGNRTRSFDRTFLQGCKIGMLVGGIYNVLIDFIRDHVGIILLDQIRDGLAVTARPEAASGPWVDAFRTASGLYAFQGLPGLRDYENGIVDLLSSPPDRSTIARTLVDRLTRFNRFGPVEPVELVDPAGDEAGGGLAVSWLSFMLPAPSCARSSRPR